MLEVPTTAHHEVTFRFPRTHGSNTMEDDRQSMNTPWKNLECRTSRSVTAKMSDGSDSTRSMETAHYDSRLHHQIRNMFPGLRHECGTSRVTTSENSKCQHVGVITVHCVKER